MVFNWKIISVILLIIIVLMIIGVIYYFMVYAGPKPIPVPPLKQPVGDQNQQAPEPPNQNNMQDTTTINEDTLINDSLNDSLNEELMITEETSDTLLIDLDSQPISDFGQSYDSNEF